MTTPSSLRELILDKAAEKEVEEADIVKKTGLPADYLEAILEQDVSKAPAFPYIRHHLISLADFLGLPQEEVVSAYKRDFAQKISGIHDKLPANRYSLPSKKKRSLYLVGAIATAAVIYLLLQLLIGTKPQLEVDFPPVSPSPFVVKTQSITITGKVSSHDKLLINGQTIPLAEDGSFSHDYLLNPEINYLEFKIDRLLADDIIVTRDVYYEPTPQDESVLTPLQQTQEEAGPAETEPQDPLLENQDL